MEEILRKKEELITLIRESIEKDKQLAKQLLNDTDLSNLALSVYMEYTYTDLLSLIEETKDDKELEDILIYIMHYKLDNTCQGCFYDKCDQDSHMGENGCLTSVD